MISERHLIDEEMEENDYEEAPEEQIVRTRAGDNLSAARCPRCGHPLIARQDCGGPYFYCLSQGRHVA